MKYNKRSALFWGWGIVQDPKIKLNIIDSTYFIRLQLFYTECENNKSVRRNQPAITKHSPDPAIYKSSKLIFGQARRGGAGVLFLAGVGALPVAREAAESDSRTWRQKSSSMCWNKVLGIIWLKVTHGPAQVTSPELSRSTKPVLHQRG